MLESSSMDAQSTQPEIVVVGAGISGATIAERFATQKNKRVLVIEKRDHIGGNCFDFIDQKTGIRVSKYGAHIFHTENKRVWDYVNIFSDWLRYEHKVLSYVDDTYVPVPVNITTVNQLFNTNIKTEAEMRAWLESEIDNFEELENSEQSALGRVGKRLYEKMFKNYTKKQWDVFPDKLDASVMNRIPVRDNFDTRYFSDRFQALPASGYTRLFENMLDHPNIKVLLNTDYFSLKHLFNNVEMLFFTGPIDRYFENKFDKLKYRSLRFQFETFDMNFFQPSAVVNYPQTEQFTRIVEYKHFYSQQSRHTVISKEYGTWEGEPYYPVPNKHNQQLFEKYKSEAAKLVKKRVYFVGRLANYKYFNMDQAFENALSLYDELNTIK